MTEDIWRSKVDQYIDGELSGEEMKAMSAHLRECAVCASDALQSFQLKRALKFAGQRYVPEATLRRKISDQVSPRNRRAWYWKPAFALAIVAVILVAAWFSYSSKQRRSEQLLTELLDIHVADLAASTPVEVASSDRHTVKPWFQGKVPFTFDLPELGNSPFTLAGGRLVYLNHEPGAQLVYNVRAHHISVFIFRETPELASSFSSNLSKDVLKFYVESWSAHGLHYFVLGDANPTDIQQLAGLLKQAGNG
jgi:anti-sigma factor RsiW